MRKKTLIELFVYLFIVVVGICMLIWGQPPQIKFNMQRQTVFNHQVPSQLADPNDYP